MGNLGRLLCGPGSLPVCLSVCLGDCINTSTHQAPSNCVCICVCVSECVCSSCVYVCRMCYTLSEEPTSAHLSPPCHSLNNSSYNSLLLYPDISSSLLLSWVFTHRYSDSIAPMLYLRCSLLYFTVYSRKSHTC